MNILVVGSSIIDFFIHLKNPNSVAIKGEIVELGLGDKIPVDIDKLTIGGNGANVSVGLTRLGIKTSFFTYLGSDILSQEIMRTIQKEGITLLSDKAEHENTSLSLIFNFQKDRIIFSHHQARHHTFEYKGEELPAFIYLTSIGKHWENAYESVISFAQKNNIPYAFSPGSHQLQDMNETFLKALTHATMVFINKKEAQVILKKMEKPYSKIEDLLTHLQSHGPKIVSVTDGHNGSYCIDENKNMYMVPAFGDDYELVEKTGAGDAYASGFLAEYLTHHELTEAMRRGAFNALSVMKHIGAQEGLLHKDEMVQVLEHHKGFKATPLQ